jgi:hypothetical protein
LSVEVLAVEVLVVAELVVGALGVEAEVAAGAGVVAVWAKAAPLIRGRAMAPATRRPRERRFEVLNMLVSR